MGVPDTPAAGGAGVFIVGSGQGVTWKPARAVGLGRLDEVLVFALSGVFAGAGKTLTAFFANVEDDRVSVATEAVRIAGH